MIIDKELTAFIKTKLIKTASVLGIENVILETDKIRGMDEKQTTIILHDHKLNLPFTAMGLSRLSMLNSRLSLAKDDDLTIDAVEDPKVSGVISRLDIKGKKFKVDFRTANPSVIKAPKGFKSAIDDFLVKIVLSEEDQDLLQKASASMPQRTEVGAVSIMINPKTNKGSFVLTDTNSDDFEMELDNNIECKITENIVVNYPLKQFLTLMKHNDNCFYVIERNLLKTSVNGITIIMLPIL